MKASFLIAFALSSSLSILILGCGKDTLEQESKVKWGILHHVRSTPIAFLYLKPGQKVCINGYRSNVATQAANLWAQAAGRDQRLIIAENCNDGQRVIQVFGPDRSRCGGQAAGYTDSVQSINVCHDYPADSSIYKHIIMHEVGHMWGLCDQYQNVNCAHGFSRINPNTVMGMATGLTKLTPDDIEGIRFVTSQPNLGANNEWLKLVSNSSTQGPSATPVVVPSPSSGPRPGSPGSMSSKEGGSAQNPPSGPGPVGPAPGPVMAPPSSNQQAPSAMCRDLMKPTWLMCMTST